MASTSTPAPRPSTAAPDQCDWTDDELEAMADEADAEADRDGWVDGPAFAEQFLAETRRLADPPR